MDIMGFPNKELKYEDSVLGKCTIAAGGVGRNIAENLARLSINVKFISAFGNDFFSKELVRELEVIGIDISHSLFTKGKAATHLALMNAQNDMTYGIASLDIIQNLTISFLQKQKTIFSDAKFIVIDANIPLESMVWMSSEFKTTPIYVDVVSTHFAKQLQPIISKFHTIKTNRIEAEIITGIKLQAIDDYKKTALYLMNKGVKRIFITAGKEGAFYADETSDGWIPSLVVKVQNTTGAGDAFMAGVVYASVGKKCIKICAKTGTKAAAIALESEKVVNMNMSEDNLNKITWKSTSI